MERTLSLSLSLSLPPPLPHPSLERLRHTYVFLAQKSLNLVMTEYPRTRNAFLHETKFSNNGIAIK